LRDIALSIVGIILSFGSGPEISATYRRHTVAGPGNATALGFADANRNEQQDIDVEPLWLAWSPHHAILAKVVKTPELHLRTIWSSNADGVPHIDPEGRTVTWRDGSSITFDKKHLDCQ
jgi:hypothetical protein